MMSGKFWNKGIMLIDGCSKVSSGCKHCWSEKMTARFNRVSEVVTDGHFNGKVRFNLHLLERAAKVKKPHVYALWNDLYHEGVSFQDHVSKLFLWALEAPQHTFLIVTKRPERAAKFFSWLRTVRALVTMGTMQQKVLFDGIDRGYPNIWHIVTCEDQQRADERIPHLLQIPGKRGIIIEPMLGGVNLMGAADLSTEDDPGHIVPWLDGIHQIILGGETGPGARPMHPDWVRSVRDQCAAAGVPFYFKSWGDSSEHKGRLLDGREHNDLAWENKK